MLQKVPVKRTGPGDKGETLASSAYQEIRADVLGGKLKPGQKLHLHVLKETYKVGNSPLREALNRLSTNGMVVREENRGFRVSEASAEELQELTRTRCWLEEVALRESMKNGGDEYDERIVLALHRLEKVTPKGEKTYSTPELEEKHAEFHLALLSECRSRFLLNSCRQLQEQSLRYRNISEVIEYREGNEGKEHRALSNAVLARDVELAVQLLSEHYMKTAEIVISQGVLK